MDLLTDGKRLHEPQSNGCEDELTPSRKKSRGYLDSHKNIEKKRRDRINNSLEALKILIPECKQHGGKKLDKAEILEACIEHLSRLHQNPPKRNIPEGEQLLFAQSDLAKKILNWVIQRKSQYIGPRSLEQFCEALISHLQTYIVHSVIPASQMPIQPAVQSQTVLPRTQIPIVPNQHVVAIQAMPVMPNAYGNINLGNGTSPILPRDSTILSGRAYSQVVTQTVQEAVPTSQDRIPLQQQLPTKLTASLNCLNPAGEQNTVVNITNPKIIPSSQPHTAMITTQLIAPQIQPEIITSVGQKTLQSVPNFQPVKTPQTEHKEEALNLAPVLVVKAPPMEVSLGNNIVPKDFVTPIRVTQTTNAMPNSGTLIALASNELPKNIVTPSPLAFTVSQQSLVPPVNSCGTVEKTITPAPTMIKAGTLPLCATKENTNTGLVQAPSTFAVEVTKPAITNSANLAQVTLTANSSSQTPVLWQRNGAEDTLKPTVTPLPTHSTRIVQSVQRVHSEPIIKSDHQPDVDQSQGVPLQQLQQLIRKHEQQHKEEEKTMLQLQQLHAMNQQHEIFTSVFPHHPLNKTFHTSLGQVEQGPKQGPHNHHKEHSYAQSHIVKTGIETQQTTMTHRTLPIDLKVSNNPPVNTFVNGCVTGITVVSKDSVLLATEPVKSDMDSKFISSSVIGTGLQLQGETISLPSDAITNSLKQNVAMETITTASSMSIPVKLVDVSEAQGCQTQDVSFTSLSKCDVEDRAEVEAETKNFIQGTGSPTLTSANLQKSPSSSTDVLDSDGEVMFTESTLTNGLEEKDIMKLSEFCENRDLQRKLSSDQFETIVGENSLDSPQWCDSSSQELGSEELGKCPVIDSSSIPGADLIEPSQTNNIY